LLQQLPKHERQEANEDVRLGPIFALMVDGTYLQFRFMRAEFVLHIGELDVRFPNLFLCPNAHVRA
jgi:hypothetical protein